MIIVAAFIFTATANPQGRDATFFVVLFGLTLIFLLPGAAYGRFARGRLTTLVCGGLIFGLTLASWAPVVITQESLALVYPTLALIVTSGISLFAALAQRD